MLNLDTWLYVLGGISAMGSALGAYFSQRNHSKLNSGSTIQITSQPVTMAAISAPSTVKTVVIDGVTYTSVAK